MEPMEVGVSLGDPAAGIATAYAIVAALVARRRAGEGQRIDTSLWEATISGSVLLARLMASGLRWQSRSTGVWGRRWTGRQDRWDLTNRLQALGVAGMPTFSSVDLDIDPHLAERGTIERLNHPVVVERAHVGGALGQAKARCSA